MSTAWDDLERAGVPIGAARSRSHAPPPAAIRRAFTVLAHSPDAIEPARREPLLAWLRAIVRHWPSRAADLAGADGERLRVWLEAQSLDTGRYLKLRRIAIANLATWL